MEGRTGVREKGDLMPSMYVCPLSLARCVTHSLTHSPTGDDLGRSPEPLHRGADVQERSQGGEAAQGSSRGRAEDQGESSQP